MPRWASSFSTCGRAPVHQHQANAKTGQQVQVSNEIWEGVVGNHLPPKATTKVCPERLDIGADARNVGTKADSSVSGVTAIG